MVSFVGLLSNRGAIPNSSKRLFFPWFGTQPATFLIGAGGSTPELKMPGHKANQ